MDGHPTPDQIHAMGEAASVARGDPTGNVKALVKAEARRQDSLRHAETKRVDGIMKLTAKYNGKLRKAETARLDAIRLVDTNAVQTAAAVQATAAQALALQVTTSAETLRAQVAATATAASTALANALEPITKSMTDILQKQYEQQGQKTAGSETTDSFATQASARTARMAVIMAGSSAGGFFLYLAIAIATHGKF